MNAAGRLPKWCRGLAIGWVLALSPVSLAAQADTLGPGDHRLWVTVGGLRREYLVHVPRGYVGRMALPVVLMFHGSGGTLEEIASTTGWSAKADDEKFLAVYPNGFPNADGMRVWSDGRPGTDARVDDVAFTRTMIEDLGIRFHIDRQRIFVVGFSNGAGLAYRLGSALSDRIAAIAPVAGRINRATEALTQPVPAFAVAGTADGGFAADTAAARRWAALSGCGGAGLPTREGRYRSVAFEGCPKGLEVVSVEVDGWEHYWPGGTNRGIEMWAENVIWKFFQRNPRRGR